MEATQKLSGLAHQPQTRGRAVVVHAKGDLRIEEVPIPAVQPGCVLVDIEYGGICGSDLHYFSHGSSGVNILKAPMILGHEVAGRISEVGFGVTGFRTGQAVAIHPATPCGHCPECARGRRHLCGSTEYFGSAARTPHADGGFVSTKMVPAAQIRPLPSNLSTRHGAVAEPLAVAIHAVRRAGELDGRTLLVNGAGPIGALVCAAARRAGAGRIVASDLSDPMLAIAKRMGANETVNVAAGQPLPESDIIFEASGSPAALGGVLAAARKGGIVVQVGNLPAGPVSAPLGALATREVEYRGSFRFDEEISTAIEYMASGLDVEPLLTHTFPVAEAERAFAVASDRRSGSSKVLLRFPHAQGR
jgi:L-idonate 5-dehydrogenase